MICPFLTNGNEEVECFKECAFYDGENKNDECPFINMDFKELNVSYSPKENNHNNEKGYYVKNYNDYFKYKFYSHC